MQAEAEIFREENLPLLAEESKLVTEYNRIRGSMTFLWEGKERTFYEIYSLLYETDRATRQGAWEAAQACLLKERQSINELWERFMPLRLKIAANAGMPDYRAYMWKQKFRFDYSPEDCKSFHAAIEQVVVPAAERVYEQRRQRSEIDSVRPWDVSVDPYADTPITSSRSDEDFLAKALWMARMPASATLEKVGSSGWPITRWMISRPAASNAWAFPSIWYAPSGTSPLTRSEKSI